MHSVGLSRTGTFCYGARRVTALDACRLVLRLPLKSRCIHRTRLPEREVQTYFLRVHLALLRLSQRTWGKLCLCMAGSMRGDEGALLISVVRVCGGLSVYLVPVLGLTFSW